MRANEVSTEHRAMKHRQRAMRTGIGMAQDLSGTGFGCARI